MSSTEPFRQRIGDFYTDVVLPALADGLDTAFPEFGWKRDARGWVATNEEMTHSSSTEERPRCRSTSALS